MLKGEKTRQCSAVERLFAAGSRYH